MLPYCLTATLHFIDLFIKIIFINIELHTEHILSQSDCTNNKTNSREPERLFDLSKSNVFISDAPQQTSMSSKTFRSANDLCLTILRDVRNS